MPVQQSYYEISLAEYSDRSAAVALLKQHRPYLEMIPSLRRPDEDFSDLLKRWRQTQVWLDKDYEWLMPPRHSHILTEGVNSIYPLFVVFSETSERIKRGLVGSDIPFVVQNSELLFDEENNQVEPQLDN
jgi:predicted AlkP superfamily pyrophosphatase or phosphodiesterase